MTHHGRSDLFVVRSYEHGVFVELIWTDGDGDSWLFTVREAAILARRFIWAAIVARYRTSGCGR